MPSDIPCAQRKTSPEARPPEKLTREEKFTHIRTHHQDNRDWTKDIADNELYGYVDEMLEFSQYLKSECTTHNIPYFDISKDFEMPRNEAFNYLFG